MSDAHPQSDNAANSPRERGPIDPADVARIMDVKVEVSVELGRRKLAIADVLKLAPNSVLEFFKRADEPLDIRVGGRLVARGEAVVMADRYGVRVTEIVGPLEHQQAEGSGS